MPPMPLRQRRCAHPVAVTVAVAALLASACANRGQDSATSTPLDSAATTPATSGPSTTDDPSTTASTTASSPPVLFGEMASPCGPALEGAPPASVDPTENGGAVIKVATATDRGSPFAPGLNGEMYDAGVAFAAWCNAQGGIRGLPLQVIDADAKIFEVPAAMEGICADAFAMVGGGLAFDEQEFPRFNDCGMIDIAGFAVTPTKATSQGQVQVLPNPPDSEDAGWWKWAAQNYPDAVQHFATITADLLTAQVVERSYLATIDAVGGYKVVRRLTYNTAGEASWTPLAQELRDFDVRSMTFVGAPELMAPLLKAMAELGVKPDVVMLDASFYADTLMTQAGAAAEGLIVRTSYVPFEEADRFPGIRSYLDVMSTYDPTGKTGGLGLQSMSAFLLFAQSAQRCIDANDGVLKRECVLSEASRVTDWTGGGIHAPTFPGSNEPTGCYVLMQVHDGRFERIFPLLDSPDDDGGGFHCDDVVDITP